MAHGDDQRKADSILAWAHLQIDGADTIADHEGREVTGIGLVITYDGDGYTCGYKSREPTVLLRGVLELMAMVRSSKAAPPKPRETRPETPRAPGEERRAYARVRLTTGRVNAQKTGA